MAMGVLLLMHLQVGLGLGNGGLWQEFLRLPTENGGTKWALLIAGSKGYENYRHQADVPDNEEGRTQGPEHRGYDVRRHRL